MYDMEELMDGGLFYIKDPHISIAEVAVGRENAPRSVIAQVFGLLQEEGSAT